MGKSEYINRIITCVKVGTSIMGKSEYINRITWAKVRTYIVGKSEHHIYSNKNPRALQFTSPKNFVPETKFGQVLFPVLKPWSSFLWKTVFS